MDGQGGIIAPSASTLTVVGIAAGVVLIVCAIGCGIRIGRRHYLSYLRNEALEAKPTDPEAEGGEAPSPRSSARCRPVPTAAGSSCCTGTGAPATASPRRSSARAATSSPRPEEGSPRRANAAVDAAEIRARVLTLDGGSPERQASSSPARQKLRRSATADVRRKHLRSHDSSTRAERAAAQKEARRTSASFQEPRAKPKPATAGRYSGSKFTDGEMIDTTPSAIPEHMRARIDEMRAELRGDRKKPSPALAATASPTATPRTPGRAPPAWSPGWDPSPRPIGSRTHAAAGTPPSRQEQQQQQQQERAPACDLQSPLTGCRGSVGSGARTPAAARAAQEAAAAGGEEASSGAYAAGVRVRREPRRSMEEQQLEENEMAMFMEVESARRHKVASGLGSTSYSPAAKLREVRAMGGELGGGSTERDEASACASTSSPPRPPRVESAPPKRSGLGKDARAGSCKDVRTASSFKQKRTPSQRAAAQPGPKPGLKRHQSSVEGLKERAQAEEKLARERERGQAAAKRILKEWCARTRGDAYSMMRSAHLFTDIFESDPLAGIELVNGNASSLKKCYHKLAAKLHPDRQRGNPTATQVLAEEVFKLITIAYQQESAKLLSV